MRLLNSNLNPKLWALSLVLLGFSAFQINAFADTGTFEKTLSVSAPVDMEIASGSGNVTVHAGANNAVHVVATIHAHETLFGTNAADKIRKLQQNPPVVQEGNTVRIGKLDDPDLQKNVSIDYDVTAPEQTRLVSHTGSGDQNIKGLQLALKATTGSGSITAENIGAEVRVASGSGNLHLSTIHGTLTAETGSGNIVGNSIAGEVYATTGSGDINVEQTAAGNVKAETGSGDLKLRGLKGALRASTGSGNVYAEGDVKSDWHVSAGSGNIDLKVPAQASFNIDAKTYSGDLSINHTVTSQVSSHKHLQGKVGNGGVLVEAHTGSGNIVVD